MQNLLDAFRFVPLTNDLLTLSKHGLLMTIIKLVADLLLSMPTTKMLCFHITLKINSSFYFQLLSKKNHSSIYHLIQYCQHV